MTQPVPTQKAINKQDRSSDLTHSSFSEETNTFVGILGKRKEHRITVPMLEAEVDGSGDSEDTPDRRERR
jgi:hypothetical protein